MRLLTILAVATQCITAHAGDDRFGFVTHFEQGWPPAVMPVIRSTGVSYIRDELYAYDWETSPGVYVHPWWDMYWLNLAKSNGLKVVGILGRNYHYRDNYDPVAMSHLAAWIARTGLVSVFEVTNEPNNDYWAYEGSTWETKLVALTNAVTAAVHAVNPAIQVIGLGAQGAEIFNMLAMGTTMNGVVYHPYATAYTPETVYEWQYLDYGTWIHALDPRTHLPKWETEWGIGVSAEFSAANQAEFLARRLLQESGLGVEHSFIYEFADNGPELYGVYSMSPFAPRPAFYAVQRIISALSGIKGGSSFVTVNSIANGDLVDIKTSAYQGANKTVVAWWIGNHDPRNDPPLSYCKLTFTVAHPYTQAYVLSPVTGNRVPLSYYQWTRAGTQFTVGGLPISGRPRLIVVSE
jgi:hypothetical protein